MARFLSQGLDSIMTTAERRSPAWQLQIYDVRSTINTINDIVLFQNGFTPINSIVALTGPRDFTGDTISIQVNEKRGDYVNGGIAASGLTINLVDEFGLFDPTLIVGLTNPSAEYEATVGRYLRKRNVVVLREGDSRIDSSLWPITFTGELIGQAGRARSRSDGPQSAMTLKAVSREAGFLKFTRTSRRFASGTTRLAAARTIAEEELGLDLSEYDTTLTGWGADAITQPFQFVEEPPMQMLAKLMFPDGVLPRFTGGGLLSQITSTITASADRTYGDLDVLRKIDRPFSEAEQPDCVTVIGLEDTMSQVVQPQQRVATSDITTGFFARDEEFEIFWSDDKSQIVLNPEARILRSVNGGISILGGGESFEFITAPGPGGGSIGVRVTINTGFAPWLVVFFLTTYIVLAAFPDLVAVVETIPVGRIAQATALSAALLIMTKIGRGQYEFIGEPMEYVFKEIRCKACVEGVGEFAENQIEIENHLVNTKTIARNAAKNALLLLQAQENPRDIEMMHDLRLEPDDIFEIPGNRRYLIDEITRTLSRNAESAARASVKAFEVTSGVIA